MFILETYAVAIIFCVITMFCWGSWANTQKLAGKKWRFELFYWDYVLGIFIAALFFAFTMGSRGDAGRSFLADIGQADPASLGSAFLGGIIFNAANILLVAAIAVAGMSVAFPVGIGIALVLGVLVNYMGQPEGDPRFLFVGVGLIAAAIILDALAYRKLPNQGKGGGMKGLALSVVAGVLMAFFYRFVADSMAKDFVEMEAGKLSPYTAMVFFSGGILVSNFLFNTILMLKPVEGEPVPLIAYFKGTPQDHLWGVVGGGIWAVGMTFSIIAFGVAGPAISYGLGQGATLVAAVWGVFIWKEFKEAPEGTNPLIALMFLGYVIGLALIILSGA